MILAQLRDYLSARRRVPLSDLAVHFDVEPDALRAMLATLIQKGRVRQIASGPTCAGCCGCAANAPAEIYEWVGTGARTANAAKLPSCVG